MFTYALLYIIVYYQLLILMFFFLMLYVNITTLQEFTVTNLLLFIKNYSSHSNQFFLLPLAMSGLPPVSFFLIKLSFLLKIFSSLSLFIQVLFIINFLLNMFFYLQFFNFTITNTYSNKLLLKITSKNHSIISCNCTESSFGVYQYWVLFTVTVVFNILGLFIFFDFYIILLSFFN